MRRLTKSIMLVTVSLVGGLVLLFCVFSLRQMYDLTPHTWGPQGIPFEEWHRAWRNKRDLYFWSGLAAFLTVTVSVIVALFPFSRRATQQIVGRARRGQRRDEMNKLAR